MKIIKIISAVLMTAMSMSLGAMINFDVINSFPMIPVYFKINNEQNWRVLNQVHCRFSMHVENDTPITVTFSPTSDNSHPTFFVFSPQVPATQAPTKQASKVPVQTNRPRHAITGFIQVHVNSLGDVIIAPQNASPTNQGQTRFGLPLAQNITYPVIAQFREQATAAATLQAQAAPAPAASPAPAPETSSATASVTVPPAPALPEPTAVKQAPIDKTTPSTTHAAAQPATAPKTVVPSTIAQKSAAKAQAKVAKPAAAAAPAVVKSATTSKITPSTTHAAAKPATAPKIVVLSTIAQKPAAKAQAKVAEPAAAAAPQAADVKKQTVLPADSVFATLNIRENDKQAQIVLKFFNLLDRVLAQAESTHDQDNLNVVGTQVVIPTPGNLDSFKDRVRTIITLTPEDARLIDQVWELICTSRADKDKDGKNIAKRINRILVDSHYMNGITTLSKLLAKFSQTQGLDQQIWQDLGPVQKLFYLKCIFYLDTIGKASEKIDSEASETSQSHEIKTPTDPQTEDQAPRAKDLTLEKKDAPTAAPSRTMAQQQDTPKDKTPTTSKEATVVSTSAPVTTTTPPVEQALATSAARATAAAVAHAAPEEDIPADEVFKDLKIAQKDQKVQTILKFFNMLVRVLQRARATNNDRACLALDRMIIAGKNIKDTFKDTVRDTMNQLTPEDGNLIEQTWNIIGENKHADGPEHTIAKRIISFLATQENMKGIDTLSALMAKFQPKQGLAETVWNQLTPMQKLFYLKCIFFKVAAVNMYEQITAALQHPGEQL